MTVGYYSGPLAMFYARDWMAVSDQPPFDRDELLKAVTGWRDSLVASVPDGSQPWEEGYGMPWLAGEVGVPAFGALMLRISCHIAGTELPPTFKAGWRFTEDPVVDRAMSEGGSVPSFLLAEIWMPDPRIGMLRCTGPNGNTIGVATTATFAQDLTSINSAIWNATPEEIVSWSESVPEASEEMDTDLFARYAFSVMWRILAFAESHRMPVAVFH